MVRCEKCRFWDIQNVWGEKKDKAQCRVNPPTIRSGGLACNASAEWPTTTNSDWCGKGMFRDAPTSSVTGDEPVTVGQRFQNWMKEPF